jgi:hypothetical protein
MVQYKLADHVLVQDLKSAGQLRKMALDYPSAANALAKLFPQAFAKEPQIAQFAASGRGTTERDVQIYFRYPTEISGSAQAMVAVRSAGKYLDRGLYLGRPRAGWEWIIVEDASNDLVLVLREKA